MGCGFGIKKEARRESIRTNPSHRPLNVSIKTFVKSSNGDLKGKYKMLKELGRGTFSTVFLSTQISTGQISALKVIKKSDLSSDLISHSLKIKEAEILTELDHPNIIKCYEVLEEPHQIILSEEYIQGSTLLEYRSSKKKLFSESDMIPLITQLLSALVYIHDRGIIHRDIKLDNIFITDHDSTIKLCDFGCSVNKLNKKFASGFFGTLMYMAPEIFKDEYNEKVDIWSTGIVIFVLTTGRPPYRVKSEDELKAAVKNNLINVNETTLGGFSKEFVDFLLGLLKVNPDERLSAKEALQHPWLQSAKTVHKVPTVIIEKFKKLPYQNVLKKVLSLYICKFFLENHKTCEFYKYFKAIDRNENGTIDKDELVAVLKTEFDEKKSEEVAGEFFKNFDLSGNGVIEFMEFVAALCEEESVLSEQNVEKVFKDVANGKGFVTIEEIGKWVGMEFSGLMGGLTKVYKSDDKIKIEEFKRLLN